jgi:CrcB protein
MKYLLLIGLGGGLGAISRAKLSGFVLHHAATDFPLGTLVVNIVGCLIAGILSGLVERQEWFSPDTRVFLFTGLLGGFTTFSAFGVETISRLKQGHVAVALSYVALSVLGGLVAVWLGMALIPHRHLAAPGSAG